MNTVVGLLLCMLCVPPLSETQQAMLDQAADGTFVDEPALYGLLDNVVAWKIDDESGAAIPDYSAIRNDPATYRGQVFLIEGQFAGRQRRFGLLRHGRWGKAVTEWAVILSENPDDVAVIFFIDRDDTMVKPDTGERVRLAGRFYKVWPDVDMKGQATDYLVFVARSAKRLGGGQAVMPMMPQLGPMILALGIVLVLGFPMLWVLRKILNKPMSRHQLSTPQASPPTPLPLPGPLPGPGTGGDPADALADLQADAEAKRYP